MLDTNILISACWKPSSLEAQVVALAVEGRLTLFLTQPVLDEYRRVIYRDKFRAHRGCLVALVDRLSALAQRVEPGPTLALAKDEDDNRLLECAAAAQADFLVTGNRKHFPETLGPTQIVNARQLFDQL